MKKLKFKSSSIAQMLTKDQMKKVVGGGYGGDCVEYASCPHKCGANGYCSSCCLA